MKISARAIALILLTLTAIRLPLSVQAAQQTDEVFFGHQWSLPDPLWTLPPTPVTFSQLSGAVSLTFTPDVCAGAYYGVGWPFQFTAQYPEDLPVSPLTAPSHVMMSVANQITQTSSGLGGCENSGSSTVFNAFAGLKMGLTVGIHIHPPQVPKAPPPDCDTGWEPWKWGCDAWTAATNVYNAAVSLANSFVGLVAGALASLGLPTSVDWSQTFDLGSVLGIDPFFNMSWGNPGDLSPLGPDATIPVAPGSIAPFYPSLFPPFISSPGIVDLGFGANVNVTPTAQTVLGTPNVNDPQASSPEQGQLLNVGGQNNLNNPVDLFEIQQLVWGNVDPNNPTPLQFMVTNLQQPITISTSIQPTLSLEILSNPSWAVTIPLPVEIPLGDPINFNLPGSQDLVYSIPRSKPLPDLIISKVILNRDCTGQSSLACSPSFNPTFPAQVKETVLVKAQVTNQGQAATSADSSAFGSFQVYYDGTLISQTPPPDFNPFNPAYNVPLSLGGGSSWTTDVSIAKFQLATEGTHAVTVCVNPKQTQQESDFSNNCNTVSLDVTAPPPPVIPGPFDFEVLVRPSAITLTAGQSATSLVTVNAGLTNTGSQSVSLTVGCASNNFIGLCPFSYSVSPGQGIPNPAGGLPAFVSILTIVTTSSSAPGTYYIGITGTGGGKTHSNTVVVTITKPQSSGTDFTVSTSTSTATVRQGGTTTIGIVVGLTTGPTQPVTLTVQGLPQTATATFRPASGNPTFSSTLSIAAGRTLPGTYTLTIYATGGGRTHTIVVTLVVTS